MMHFLAIAAAEPPDQPGLLSIIQWLINIIVGFMAWYMNKADSRISALETKLASKSERITELTVRQDTLMAGQTRLLESTGVHTDRFNALAREMSEVTTGFAMMEGHMKNAISKLERIETRLSHIEGSRS